MYGSDNKIFRFYNFLTFESNHTLY